MRITGIVLLIIISLSGFGLNNLSAQATGEVNITARVNACTANIFIKPEKRIPRLGNFQNINSIVFYNELGQELYKFEKVISNSFGYADLDLCSLGITPNPGIYSIYVKGYSHISKHFIDNKGFFNSNTEFNLAKSEADFLLAGDTTDNDYINSLDFDVLTKDLYTNNMKTDLNRDGKVNSLDLSNLIYNLHKEGELIK